MQGCERNIGGILPLIILTNADEVELQFAGGTKQRFAPATDRFPHLPHPPVIIERDDVAAEEFGKWGMDWQDLEIASFVDGQKQKVVCLAAEPVPTRLQVEPDQTNCAGLGQEEVRVIVRALDQTGGTLPFLADHISIDVEGPATLIGPSQAPLLGGTTGFWVRLSGEPGEITINVSSTRLATQTVKLKT